ncbi:spore photoproduct lyase [Pelotomaculum terephthalicicum JT]|uniref:spore photoproduct lyase n=1 Tax=Pelotomaculum TaxID=191373 RepID=UPI0009D49A61|nr:MULTISPECIES: spore photoproduct lyase [Pelotomaculum]MCG9968220.1 spore photoproduct lyase [Pelotomaculum terephthalicicum JT]OPX89123.1 MAG: Spore photoproduct lyase [Pelotomaculum sp. PtaB.Bin117]OPY60537.1 MAG: Spore photoproduct lyase [Pelotomaculum sp. PtaU1.Bin065]
MVFIPQRVIFEPDSLRYPLGDKLLAYFKDRGVETGFTSSHNRVTSIPGKTPGEGYFEGKRTLVVGVRRTMRFETCRPSAHFQLPLATSCPGKCEYCYLLTNLGRKPYIRIYVNTEEILSAAKDYLEKRKPAVTVFEGAATSDPIPTEPYTGILRKAIEFFGEQGRGRFRFVTKFTDVDTLLEAPHHGHTRFRFSINTGEIIRQFEHATPPLEERLAAAKRVASAGYPLGFLVAPIIVSEGWRESYRELFKTAAAELDGKVTGLTFEFITHRFTKRAKSTILEVFPNTRLDLEEEDRTFKFGQFGYGKYVYPKELFAEVKAYFEDMVGEFFPDAKAEYFV